MYMLAVSFNNKELATVLDCVSIEKEKEAFLNGLMLYCGCAKTKVPGLYDCNTNDSVAIILKLQNALKRRPWITKKTIVLDLLRVDEVMDVLRLKD